jgi:hypothetical protein
MQRGRAAQSASIEFSNVGRSFAPLAGQLPDMARETPPPLGTARSQAAAKPLPRGGFFPRAPGPNVLAFALLIGVAPSIFATFYVLLTGLDGGFYMPPSFLEDQQNALGSLCLIVILAACVALIFLLNSFRNDSTDKGGRIGIACALGCLIAWDLFFFMGLRASLATPRTQSDIHAMADTPGSSGFEYTYDGRTFWVETTQGDPSAIANLSPSDMGPYLCRELGSVFQGPVQYVGLRATGPENAVASLEIRREDCREWYLRDRRPINQPAERPRDAAAVIRRIHF